MIVFNFTHQCLTHKLFDIYGSMLFCERMHEPINRLAFNHITIPV